MALMHGLRRPCTNLAEGGRGEERIKRGPGHLDAPSHKSQYYDTNFCF